MKAKVFDGISPVEQEWELTAGSSALYCTGPGCPSLMIGRKEITRIDEKSASIRIHTVPVLPESSGLLIEVSDPVNLRELKSALSRMETDTLSGRIRSMGRGSRIIALIILLLLSAAFWRTILTEGYRLIPHEADLYLGRMAMKQAKSMGRVYDDPSLTDILEKVSPGAKKNGIKIHMMANPMVNAFALPGGDIIVCSGLVKESRTPDELAGIIAHETAHIELRHSMQQIVKNTGISILVILTIGSGFDQAETAETLAEISGMLINLKYSRGFEEEADKLGAEKLNRAGISTEGLAGFLERLPEQKGLLISYLSTHPENSRRAKILRSLDRTGKKNRLIMPMREWTELKKRNMR